MGHETAGQNFYLLPNKWFINREQPSKRKYDKMQIYEWFVERIYCNTLQHIADMMLIQGRGFPL